MIRVDIYIIHFSARSGTKKPKNLNFWNPTNPNPKKCEKTKTQNPKFKSAGAWCIQIDWKIINFYPKNFNFWKYFLIFYHILLQKPILDQFNQLKIDYLHFKVNFSFVKSKPEPNKPRNPNFRSETR